MLKEKDFIFFDDKDKFLKILKRKLPTKKYNKVIARVNYNKELLSLQSRLVDLQNWIINNKMRVCIIFEGRDAAGKGGAIKRFTQHLNPRRLKVIALPRPTIEEKGQWYFQRYVENLPKEGNMIFFDRSWYNRAVVEPVNKFCTENEYNIFMSQVNEFEKMLIDSEFYLLKFYFSMSKEMQLKRFNEIKNSPIKRWKYTKVDKKAQGLWKEYTHYKDVMFKKTNTKICPWNIIQADKKIYARTKAISMILGNIPYDKNYKIIIDKINF